MFDVFGLSDAGCVRRNNEDRFLIAHDIGLYVVADGMGGEQAGECASRLAVDTVAEYLAANDRSAEDALVNAFHEAHRSVLAAASSAAELQGMATTLVAALEQDGELRIASAGDSRAYLYESGTLGQLTRDHTWVNEIGIRLGLGEAALENHPMRHVVTVAVGGNSLLRVGTVRVRPRPGSLVLLCSDGLHGVIHDSELTELLVPDRSLDVIARTLVDAARRAGGPDNITAVLLRACAD